MAPGLAVWLDVDDLIHIGDLEGYIRSSRMVLVFCTSGYFSSKNCMRELRMAVKLRKAIIPLVETDPLKGGVAILGVYTAHTYAHIPIYNHSTSHAQRGNSAWKHDMSPQPSRTYP